jgi:hypothetical protein
LPDDFIASDTTSADVSNAIADTETFNKIFKEKANLGDITYKDIKTIAVDATSFTATPRIECSFTAKSGSNNTYIFTG